MKIILLSSFKKYSAIWKYAFEINKYFKSRSFKWLNLYTKNKYFRTFKLFNKLKENYDVLICSSPLLCNFINKNKGFNIVIVHDLYPLSVGKTVSFLEKILYRIIYSKIKYADFILFVSESSRNEFNRLFNLDIKHKVLPGGIDHSVFKPSTQSRERIKGELSLPSDKFIICHVGTDEYRKNFVFVLKILERLLKSGINAHLVKIGSLQKETLKYISSKNLNKNLSILTDLNEERLAKIYQSSDVFLFPSLYEGLGLPPIEAMACGCPAIVSDKTSLVEVGIPETILKLRLDDWAKQIIKIKKNSKYKNLLIKNGIEKAKEFDWNKYCDSLNKIIKKFTKK